MHRSEYEVHTAFADETSALPESRIETTCCSSPFFAARRNSLVLSDCNVHITCIILTIQAHLRTFFNEAAKFGIIMQNNSHYAVQGHSRSPILVPIESTYAYATSYLASFPSYCKLLVTFVFLTWGEPPFNSFVSG